MPTNTPKHVLYYGVDRPPTRMIHLRAGPLLMTFDPKLAYLRRIRLGRAEVLRGIYVAVRDGGWGTPANRLSNLKIERTDGTFALSFDAACRDGEIDFRWRGTITGGEDGTVTYAMDGAAAQSFTTQRVGFCVLHPIDECAGRPCVIEKVDGSRRQDAFGYHIAPRQPFRNVRAIRHEVAASLTAEVRFAGAVFETEDQRNWTDASYKTYSLPPGGAAPYTLAAGRAVRQVVTLSLDGTVPAELPKLEPEPTQVTLRIEANDTKPLPKIGLCSAPGAAGRGGDRRLARLRALNPAHLRLDIDLREPAWPDALNAAAADARAIGVPLELAATVSDAAADELAALAGRIGQLRPGLARVLVFYKNKAATPLKYVELSRRALEQVAVDAPVGTGVKSDFCELNRRRPNAGTLEAICWAVSPQVHAFDDETIIENLAGQWWTVETARQFAGAAAPAVGPVTLRGRGQDDPRQASLLGAAWTLGSIKHLARAGAGSVSYYQTTGPSGVMSDDGEAVYPLYHVLADVGAFAGGTGGEVVSSDPLVADAMCLVKGGRRRILVANFTPRPITVHLAGAGGPGQLRMLDETSADRAMRQPGQWRAAAPRSVGGDDGAMTLGLPPFAVARLDLTDRRQGD